MPWTLADVEGKIKGLSPKQKRTWVQVANGALKRCQAEDGGNCEASAIKQANAAAKRISKGAYSFEDIQAMIRVEAGISYPHTSDGPWAYVREVFLGSVVIEFSGKYFLHSYIFDSEGIVLGEGVEVQNTWVPKENYFVEKLNPKSEKRKPMVIKTKNKKLSLLDRWSLRGVHEELMEEDSASDLMEIHNKLHDLSGKIDDSRLVAKHKIVVDEIVKRGFSHAPFGPRDDLDKGEYSVVVTPQILKADDEQQVIFGIVYEPDVEDTDGDAMKAEDIEEAAHYYMMHYQVVKIQHDGDPVDCPILESYVAPADFDVDNEHVTKGTWLMSIFVPDKKLWKSVKDGTYGGFSMGLFGLRGEWNE